MSRYVLREFRFRASRMFLAWRRRLALVMALVVVMAGVDVLELASPAAAVSGSGTGLAGVFVPVSAARILDTRSGAGGYTGSLSANVWHSVPVTGVGDVPSSGVASVALSVTVISPATPGNVAVASSSYTGAVTTTAVLYDPGMGAGSYSGTAMTAVGSDGAINVRVASAVGLIIDVQGYFTAGDGTPAPGGFVPMLGSRFVDTRNGIGLPTAKIAGGSPKTITIGGLNGVPANASAIFATVSVLNQGNTAQGYATAAASTSLIGVSMSYQPSVATSFGANIDLSSSGTFIFTVKDGSPVDLIVDVFGYYTATDGTTGAFTPASTRVYDSRPMTLAGNSTTTIPVAGIKGVPAAGSGISAIAIEVQTIKTSGSTPGWLRLWPDDKTEPAAAQLNYSGSSGYRSALAVVQVGADGGIKLHVNQPDPVAVVLDVVGWYSNVLSPISNGQSITGRYTTLQAGSGGGTWVSYTYRVGITGSFANVPVANVVVPGTSTHPTGWPVGQTSGKFSPYTWDVAATVGMSDQLVQVQACYGTSSTDPAPLCSMPANVQLAVSGFQNAYSSTTVGPGLVSELTGDYQVSAVDADVTAYLSDLSVSRSLTTLAPTGEQAGPAGVFGPSWTAAISGPSAGDADLRVTDKSAQGYLNFTAADGSVSTYQAATAVGTYPTSFAGVGAAAADGKTVKLLSASSITMTDDNGTVTTWAKNGSTWAVSGVIQSGSTSVATFSYDGSGMPTRILGAVPAGVSCANPDATAGCRSLTLTYTTVTVGGVAKTRLAGVNLVAYNPATSAMATTQIAAYSYDSTGRLSASWDPRITSNLKTTYTYDGNGRLATLTPPGQAAWSMSYNSSGQLNTITRPDPSGSTAQWTVVYSVPASGSGAPIDLSAATTAAWGQNVDPAATGTAIFGPNRVPAGTSAATVSTADWPYGGIDYLDVNGQVVNAAAYGAGAWQYDATTYDNNGEPVWTLTPGNRAQALTPTTDTDTAVAALTSSAARANLLASTTIYSPTNPSLVSDTYGPTHPVVLASGTSVHARTHTNTVYDEGNPGDSTALTGLPTTVTTSAQTPDGVDNDKQVTRLGYAAITAGDITGWVLGAPTTRTMQMGSAPSAADLVTTTRYDNLGRVVEQRLPAGASGGDARTTLTTYYTATGTGPCLSAATVGLICQTGPATQPTTGNPLPVITNAYDVYGHLTTKTETAGATVRITSTSYDPAERVTGSSITVTPTATVGTAVPAITSTYDNSTGRLTSSSAGGKTLTTGYDNLGRATSYTDANGTTSNIGYDLAGRVTTRSDGKGAYTYSYDTSSEHRGLATGETIGVGTAPGTFAAAYTPDGSMATVTYPSGMGAWYRYDNTGAPSAITYGQGSTTWAAFNVGRDAQGRITTQTGSAGVERYAYDQDGRLTTIQDTQTTGASTAGCTTRAYAFDKNSNRTTLTSYPDGSNGTSSNGNCSTSTTPTSTASTYDQADRITNPGYTYDTLGRTLNVPAADAQSTGAATGITGPLTIGYYANDMVATQAQGGATRAFTLDPAQNRLAAIDDGTTTAINHYADKSDSPSWTGQTPDATPSTETNWSRYILGPNDTLVGTQTDTGTVNFTIADLEGTIIGAVPDTAATTGITNSTTYTEYGSPRNPSAAGNYGWLGTEQRAAADLLGGLLSMGVRLYNPSTARFLSVDPIYMGNDDAYVYPSDPTGQMDTSGAARTHHIHRGNGGSLFGSLQPGPLLRVILSSTIALAWAAIFVYVLWADRHSGSFFRLKYSWWGSDFFFFSIPIRRAMSSLTSLATKLPPKGRYAVLISKLAVIG